MEPPHSIIFLLITKIIFFRRKKKRKQKMHKMTKKRNERQNACPFFHAWDLQRKQVLLVAFMLGPTNQNACSWLRML